MRKTFMELKRLSKKASVEKDAVKLALMGDCSTQHLKMAIKGMAIDRGVHVDVWEAEYNQILPQIMDDSSDFYAYDPEIVVLYVSSEKLLEEYQKKTEGREKLAENTVQTIESYWEKISSQSTRKIIHYQFVEIDDKVYGSYAAKVESSFLNIVRKVQYMLQISAMKYKNVYIMDLDNIQSEMGRKVLFDDKLWYIAKMPLSFEALPVVAERTIQIVEAIRGKIKKCIICDLDNTLWGGTVAEDGIEGIRVGELGDGRAFTELQKWLKQLKERGIILAVCSKNEEGLAKAVFENNPYMELALDDFAVFIANYEDKAANIKQIQSILNIGFDSMVFLDDNSFERNLVRGLVPDITVPELPEEPERYLSYLKDLNLFESISFSEEDGQRTKQYQEEAKRQELLTQFSSYQDYLKNLDMHCTTGNFDKLRIPRIAQLTQRSNQFNLRTIRYTEKEIEEIADNPQYLSCFFELADKFGCHGLISAVILKKLNNSQLFIDTWIMSCRVLKRGVEDFVMNTIVEMARQNGYERIIGEYIPTNKNAMVKDLLSVMGFSRSEENQYSIKVEEYSQRKTEIKG